VEVPAGLVTFSNRFVIHDSGEPDETAPEVRTTPIAGLPDDTLLFLVSSRYCDSDKLADFAWSRFGNLSGGAACVRAISDFVHAKIRFNYMDARSTRAVEGIGVCRDFAHLAIALCMNIPARYCTGYLGDIGVPPDVNPGGLQRLGRGLSRRALVHDGRAPQPSPHRPHRHGPRPRRRRRRDVDRLRRRPPRALCRGDPGAGSAWLIASGHCRTAQGPRARTPVTSPGW
jgi:hypothetical protein